MRTLSLVRPLVPLTAVALLTAAALLGPPRITVREVTGTPITPGAVLDITAEHHTDEERPDVSGRAITERNGERVTQALTLTAAATKGRYGVAKQWAAGTPWVLVFTVKQGQHGEHGTAESIVRVRADGRIAGIEQLGGQNARGDRFPRAATDAEIEAALRSVRGR